MTTMTRGLAQEVKRRAFRELRQRDEEGSFLDLNYRQKQAFNEKDVAAVRPILDQRLKRTKRTLWGMGLSVPIVLVLELYLELYWWPGSAGEGGVRGALGLAVSALWAMFFMGYALKVSATKTIYVGSACGALACLARFNETSPVLRVTWIYWLSFCPFGSRL